MAETTEIADELLDVNPLHDYNADERRYSVHVRETLLGLLRGDRDEMDLLAKYHQEPDRLGAVPLPPTVDARELRFSRVEEILSAALHFLHDGTEGGPTAQFEDLVQGVIVQRRDFPTRFPHIVIERTDHYDPEKGEPIDSRWCVYRLQNQRQNIRLNQVLGVANLGLELLKWFVGPPPRLSQG